MVGVRCLFDATTYIDVGAGFERNARNRRCIEQSGPRAYTVQRAAVTTS